MHDRSEKGGGAIIIKNTQIRDKQRLQETESGGDAAVGVCVCSLVLVVGVGVGGLQYDEIQQFQVGIW